MSSAPEPTAPPPTPFQDTSTDCAICLSPLSPQPCLTLTCGHIYHTSCLQEQLRRARPDPSKRLLFTGCYCAKCARPCSHPSLTAASRALTDLREQVDALALHHAAADGLRAAPGQPLLALARRIYAFYQCAACHKPYFGGTVACADDPLAAVPDAERRCPPCATRVATPCARAEHIPHRVWKCRYCCAVASFLCYGSVHFCSRCHASNAVPRRSELCPGTPRCVLLAPGEPPHRNGPEPDCEQVLFCASCESGTADGDAGGHDAATRSPNMVYNPCAAHGLAGWDDPRRGWHGYSWGVEASEQRFGECERNFVSSHAWCSMAQVVRLGRFLRRPGETKVECSVRYMGRWDCESVLRMEAVLMDAQGRELQAYRSGELKAAPDYWHQQTCVLDAAAGACFALLAVHGTDSKNWAGWYGAKVTGCSVSAVYPDEGVGAVDEDGVVLREAFEDVREETGADASRVLRRFWNSRQRQYHAMQLY